MRTVAGTLIQSMLPEGYEDLKSTIVNNLKSLPGIFDIVVDRRGPCTENEIYSWEQFHAITLPLDLKEFYKATNGFEVTWSYSPVENGGDDVKSVASGRLGVRRLEDLRRLTSVRVEGGINAEAGSFDPRPRDPCFSESGGAVLQIDSPGLCLHLGRKSTVWFVDRGLDWHFLAPSFHVYLLIMILHQGLPYWMYSFTPYGLPPPVEALVPTFAPYLLEFDSPRELDRLLRDFLFSKEKIKNKLNVRKDDEEEESDEEDHTEEESDVEEVGENEISANEVDENEVEGNEVENNEVEENEVKMNELKGNEVEQKKL